MPRLRPLIAAVAVLVAGTLAVGCGEQQPDRDFGTFTNCAKIGRLSTATDPADDQLGSGDGAQGDLLGIDIARSASQLCVEYDVRSAVQAAAVYALYLRPTHADTPVVQLQVAILAAATPEIIIKNGAASAQRDVAGVVGVRDDRLTVLVGRTAFVAAGAGAIFDSFRWQARTAVSPSAKERLTDCAVSCR